MVIKINITFGKTENESDTDIYGTGRHPIQKG